MIRRFAPQFMPAMDFQINRNSVYATGLIGAWKTVPGKGLLYYNLLRGNVRYYVPGGMRGNSNGDALCWDVLLPNADTSDYGFTSGPWSVMVWFDCIAQTANGEYPTIIGRATYVNETNNQGWVVGMEAANDPEPKQIAGKVFNNNGSGLYDHQSGYVLNNGQRYVAALTSNGSSRRRLYVYGYLLTTETGSQNYNAAADASGLFYICNKLATGWLGFHEARIYNRELFAAPDSAVASELYWPWALQNWGELWQPVISRTYFPPGTPAVLDGGARSQAIVIG